MKKRPIVDLQQLTDEQAYRNSQAHKSSAYSVNCTAGSNSSSEICKQR